MLRIEHLTKRYGDKVAVNDLSLHIEKGEIYGFIGHNGAGKTTTLKSISGIINCDEGDILVDGKSIKNDPIGCKKIMAYIPDNPDIYTYMKGIEYLNFVCDMYGIPQSSREEKIEKYAREFEIYDDLSTQISAYSHGMKQKLVIISALIHNPKLIIMDEPFVGLDPKATFKLKTIMREICDNGGSFFFSTHVLDVAEKLCDHVAIISEGNLVSSGSIEEVKGDSSLESVFLKLESENA